MANNREGGVDVWLALRQPIALRRILSDTEGVSRVSLTRGRDLSPESEDAPLTVVLGAQDPGDNPGSHCVHCKEPLDAGTMVCPACGKTQA